MKVDAEQFLKFQKGQLCGQELLIGEETWNHFEAAQKYLFNGGTLELTIEGKVVALMSNHNIDGYYIRRVHAGYISQRDK